MNIGPFSYDEYLNAVKSFHGYAAPGLMMGGFMVDLALQHMPDGVLFDAVCETRNCLPDAVQLLTPCTVGNGWLRILNLGRYALSFFDKYKGGGICTLCGEPYPADDGAICRQERTAVRSQPADPQMD